MAIWAHLDLEAVAFDLFGTLVSMDHLRRLARAHFPAKGDELVTQWLTGQDEHAWVRTLAGAYRPMDQVTVEALDAAAARLHLTLSPMLRRRLLRAQVTPQAFPEAQRTLAALAAERPLAILSNGTPAMLQYALHASGLTPYFSQVSSADEVRRYKPAPEPYRALAQALGHPPDRILFVTAHSWDLVGAIQAGMRTAWLNPESLPPEYAGLRPDLTLASLSELIPDSPRLG